jgi:hypothetical protein
MAGSIADIKSIFGKVVEIHSSAERQAYLAEACGVSPERLTLLVAPTASLAGTVQVVEQHDGSKLALRKLDADYDPHDRLGAMTFLQKHAAKGQIVTGLLYVDPEAEDLHANLDTVERPLNTLDEKALCPGSAALDKINASLR